MRLPCTVPVVFLFPCTFHCNGSLVGALKMPLILKTDVFGKKYVHIMERFHDIANNIDSLILFLFFLYNWQEKYCPHSLYLHFFCRSPKGFCLSRKIRVWSKSCCETEKCKNICIALPIRLFSQIVSWAVRRKLGKPRRSLEFQVFQIWDWGKSQPRNYLQSNPAKRGDSMEEYDGSMMMEENRSLLMKEEDNQAWLSFRHTIEQVGIIILVLKLLQSLGKQ